MAKILVTKLYFYFYFDMDLAEGNVQANVPPHVDNTFRYTQNNPRIWVDFGKSHFLRYL